MAALVDSLAMFIPFCIVAFILTVIVKLVSTTKGYERSCDACSMAADGNRCYVALVRRAGEFLLAGDVGEKVNGTLCH